MILVKGDITENKINSALIDIYKRLDNIDNVLASMKEDLSNINERLKALEEE